MTPKETASIFIHRWKAEQIVEVTDVVAIEEPLEISLSYWVSDAPIKKNISITMRTPGKDKELAIGFLFTEGILLDMATVDKVEQVSENEICVHVKQNVVLDLSKIERHFYTSSSCGVCGKSSIESIRTVQKRSNDDTLLQIDSSILLKLNEKVAIQQSIFESTGGLHASALFDSMGHFISVYEDVGRHNALDKLIGACFFQGKVPLRAHILFLSGRASFELIQKAAMAEIPIICALGAPSSLAIELAKEFNITLVGFLKMNSFNIYSCSSRIS
jgi:FdhD protein